VIPLLIEHGANVTTAQMAHAAGIAEGTIFRAFPDKTALLHEAVRTSLDASEALERIAAVDRSASLDDQLRSVSKILVERADRVHALVGALRSFPPSDPKHGEGAHRAAMEANSLILWSITRLLQDHSHLLRVEPARAAVAFRGLLHAVNFPLTEPSERMTVDEVVEVFLRGVSSETGV
jgi:AcrR family transcriptional regulator